MMHQVGSRHRPYPPGMPLQPPVTQAQADMTVTQAQKRVVMTDAPPSANRTRSPQQTRLHGRLSPALILGLGQISPPRHAS